MLLKRSILSAMILSFAVMGLSGVSLAADKGVSITPQSAIYSYDENDLPAIFFFPPENARWNGNDVTMREWYLLTDLQKEKFISEYTEELKRKYKKTFEVIWEDYLGAMNTFSYYMNEKNSNEPSAKFINELLRGQGKI